MKKSIIYIYYFWVPVLLLLTGCNHENEGRAKVNDPDREIRTGEMVFTCPMHPEIVRNEPGSCPICKMDLVLRPSGAQEPLPSENTDSKNSISGLVQTNVKTITPVFKTFSSEFTVQGYVAYDPEKIFTVASKVEGRIEKLYVKYSYQKVKKGEQLLDIYSHSLLTAQSEYLYLKDKEGKGPLLSASRKKLQQLGMTERQIEGMHYGRHLHPTTTIYSPYTGYVLFQIPEAGTQNNVMSSTSPSMNSDAGMAASEEVISAGSPLPLIEGSFVGKGMSLFNIVNTSKVWGILEVFSMQLPYLHKGMKVIVYSSGNHDSTAAAIKLVEPATQSQGTTKVRIELNNEKNNFKIGSLITGKFKTNAKRGLLIPSQALVDLGNEHRVFVKSAGGFKTRKVEIGPGTGTEIEIIDGLTEKDEIALNAQMLVDSESFVKGAAGNN